MVFFTPNIFLYSNDNAHLKHIRKYVTIVVEGQILETKTDEFL